MQARHSDAVLGLLTAMKSSNILLYKQRLTGGLCPTEQRCGACCPRTHLRKSAVCEGKLQMVMYLCAGSQDGCERRPAEAVCLALAAPKALCRGDGKAECEPQNRCSATCRPTQTTWAESSNFFASAPARNFRRHSIFRSVKQTVAASEPTIGLHAGWRHACSAHRHACTST